MAYRILLIIFICFCTSIGVAQISGITGSTIVCRFANEAAILAVDPVGRECRLALADDTGVFYRWVGGTWLKDLWYDNGQGIILLDATTENVGIGTGLPDLGKLHVRQISDAATQGIALENSTFSANARFWLNGDVLNIYSGNTGNNKLALNAGGGSVGIGTTNPLFPLDIYGAANFNNDAYVKNGNSLRFYNGSNSYYTRVRNTDSYFLISSGNNSVSPAIAINHDGFVGITESSPDYNLHITSDAGASFLMMLENTTTAAVGFQMRSTNGTTSIFESGGAMNYNAIGGINYFNGGSGNNSLVVIDKATGSNTNTVVNGNAITTTYTGTQTNLINSNGLSFLNGGNVVIGGITQTNTSVPLTVNGPIEIGSASATSGTNLIYAKYSLDDVIGVIGAHYGTGALMLGYGVGGEGMTGALDWRSTYDNFSGRRSVVFVGSELGFYTAPTQATTVGDPITGMDRVFNVGVSGNVSIGGSHGASYFVDVINSGGANLGRFKDADSAHDGLILWGDVNGSGIGNGSGLLNKEGFYFYDASDAIRVYTNGAERGRWTTDGLSIGTAGNGYNLRVLGTSYFDGDVSLRGDIKDYNNTDPEEGQLLGGNNLNGAEWRNYFGAATTGGVADWNDVTNTRAGSGYTLLTSVATNGMGGASVLFHPFNIEYSTQSGAGNVTQFAIPYAYQTGIDAGLYYRGRYSGVWSDWEKILTTSNTTGTIGGWTEDVPSNRIYPTSIYVSEIGFDVAGVDYFKQVAAQDVRLYLNDSPVVYFSESGAQIGLTNVKDNTPFVTGGNVYTNGIQLAIGTQAQQDFLMFTHNTQRLRLSQFGDLVHDVGQNFTVETGNFSVYSPAPQTDDVVFAVGDNARSIGLLYTSAVNNTATLHFNYHTSTVDEKILTIDGFNKRVGILNPAPYYTFDVGGGGNAMRSQGYFNITNPDDNITIAAFSTLGQPNAFRFQGNTTNSPIFIMTSNAGTPSIYFNSVSNSYFNTTGNFGINTSAPLETLHVDGDMQLQTNALIHVNGNIAIDIDKDNNQTDRVFRITQHDGLNELFRVQENGYVGIQTATPNAPLTFAAAVYDYAKLNLYDGHGYGFGVSASDLDYYSASNHKWYSASTASTQGALRMTLANNGNLLLGTETNAAQLTIVNTNGVENGLRIYGNGSQTANVFEIRNSGAVIHFAVKADGQLFSNYNAANGYVLTSDASGNYTPTDPATLFTDTDTHLANSALSATGDFTSDWNDYQLKINSIDDLQLLIGTGTRTGTFEINNQFILSVKEDSNNESARVQATSPRTFLAGVWDLSFKGGFQATYDGTDPNVYVNTGETGLNDGALLQYVDAANDHNIYTEWTIQNATPTDGNGWYDWELTGDDFVYTSAVSDIAPTSISGTVNNYNPSGFGDAKKTIIIASLTASASITGVAAIAVGGEFYIVNSSSYALTIKFQNTNSTSANRFQKLPGNGDLVLLPGEGAEFIYSDVVSAGWYCTSTAQ